MLDTDLITDDLPGPLNSSLLITRSKSSQTLRTIAKNKVLFNSACRDHIDDISIWGKGDSPKAYFRLDKLN